MHNHSDLSLRTWKPFEIFGLQGDFWNIESIILVNTWVVLAIILIAALYLHRCLKNEKSLMRCAVLQYTQTFRELLIQSLHHCPLAHLAMIGSFFTFILLCNIIQIIPWCEEPTSDINTTLALGLVSFLYVHGYSIATKGIVSYIKHYFEPFALMFPLHIVGALSSIISISFRLFGNIFGGAIIASLYANIISNSILKQSLGLLTGINFAILLFGIAEGVIQAFVFTILTLTYLSMEIAPDDDHESDNQENSPSPLNMIP